MSDTNTPLLSRDPLAELDAMRAVAVTLQPLDEGGRRRVLNWAIETYLGTLPPTSRPANATAVTPSPAGQGSEQSDPPGPSSNGNGAGFSEFTDLADFFHACSPKTDADKALVVSGWLQWEEGQDGLDSFRVNTALKNLGYGIGNITRAFEVLMSIKPALMIQLRKAGTTRQARKTYRVTDAGQKRLRLMISESGAL